MFEVLNAAVEAVSSDIWWICDLLVGTTTKLERCIDAEVAAIARSFTHRLASTSIFRRRLRSVALRDGSSFTTIHDQSHLLQCHTLET